MAHVTSPYPEGFWESRADVFLEARANASKYGNEITHKQLGVPEPFADVKASQQ